ITYSALIWCLKKVLNKHNYNYIAHLLMKKGANINLTASDGTTPLMEATRKGDTDIVYYLIRNRASVNATNRDGQTALDIAKFYGKFDLISILQEAQKDSTSFIIDADKHE
ncbi:MAG: ankyrin repeat domain-containing protein, partial [Candidatus Cloacimonetes bacterium]|nr:ankyrin repeat domain-containing protein [Candidatus Cloacimonadota bacterium]